MPDAPAIQTRGARLRRGIGAGLLYRIVSAVVPILLVPLALDALGKGSYAIWMLATGVTSLFAFADLGLGNTLMSRIAALQTDSTARNRIQTLLTASYVTLASVAVVLWTILAIFLFSGEWRDVMSVEHASTSDAIIVLVTLSAFLVNIPLSLVHRVLFGMQRVAQSYFWQAVGPVVSLALGLTLPMLLSSPVAFVVGVAAGPVLANVLSSAWYFSRNLRPVRPRLSLPTAHDVKILVGSGLTFLVISVAMAASVALDTLLLPHFVSLEEVADFSVVWRLYAQVGMVLSLMSLPFWPIAAEALARRDVQWVQRTIRKMQAANLAVMGVVTALGVSFGQLALDVWLNGRVTADRGLVLGFSIWWLLQAVTYPLFMVQNAALRVRTQMWCWIAFLVLTVVTKILVLNEWADPSLLPWISSALYVLILLPCAWGVTRKVLRDAPSASSEAQPAS